MTHTHTQRGNWMNALYCVRVCICVCVPLFHKYIGFCSFVRGFSSRGSLSRRVLECKLVTTFSCVINYASVLLGWMLSTKAEYVRIVQTNKINKFWQKNSNPFSMANGLEINSTKSISIKNAVQCVYGWLATKKLLSHRFFEQIFGAIRVTLVCVVCGAVLFHLFLIGLPLIWTAFSIVYSRIISAFLLYKYMVLATAVAQHSYTHSRCHHFHHRRLHKYSQYESSKIDLSLMLRC